MVIQQQYQPEKLAIGLFGGLLSVTLIAGAIMANTRTLATSTTGEDEVTIKIASACSIAEGGHNYTGTIIPGQAETYGPGIIKSVCNDAEGYALYAIGYSNNSYTTPTNTQLIGTNGNINTGTSGDGSYWGMTVEATGTNYIPTIDNSYNSLHVIPSTYEKIAHYPGVTDGGDSAVGSSVQVSYTVKTDVSQVAGTYTGAVKYILVHPNSGMAPGTYTIAFNANGGSGTMSPQTGLYNYEPQTISANTFTPPTGKVFGGWCSDNASQSTCADSALFYPAGGTVEPSTVTASDTLTLYAIWTENPVLYMQNATSTDCGQTMYDSRDASGSETAYTTAKINGLCWMTTNLSLGDSSPMTLTPDDTNIGSNYTLPASSKTGFEDPTAENVFKSSSADCTSADGCYGYYTYAAATAGTNPSSGEAGSDICPKGWRLPTSTELTTLIGTYTTGATLTGEPFLAVYGGYYYFGEFYDGGGSGSYWASTADDSDNAYNLYFDSIGAAVDSGYKYYGNSIRCVAGS